jgi:hypothetical protein
MGAESMERISDDDLAAEMGALFETSGGWLQKLARPQDAVIVLTLWPSAALGVFDPNGQAVQVLAAIDAAGAEICHAASPVVQWVIGTLTPAEQSAVAQAVERGGRLQLLIEPYRAECALRLVNATDAKELRAFGLSVDDSSKLH